MEEVETRVGGAAHVLDYARPCEIDFDWLPSKGQSGWTMLVTKTGTRTDFHNTSKKIHKLATYAAESFQYLGTSPPDLLTWVSLYEKGKTSVDSNEAKNNGV